MLASSNQRATYNTAAASSLWYVAVLLLYSIGLSFNYMARKKFTKAAQKFLFTKLAEGYNVAEIHRRWPEKINDVKPNTIYKMSLDDEEFAKGLDIAYTLFFYNKQEELDRLSTGLASEIYPDVPFREAEAALKRRIDALKFTLAKSSAHLSKRWDKSKKIEVEGDIMPQIVIANYALPDEKVVSSTIEHPKLTK